MKLFTQIFILFLSTLSISAQKIDHSKFNALLTKNVTATGSINYTGIKGQMAKIDEVIKEYAAIKPEKYSKNEQLAYYINYYNAATIKLIVDNWPIKSITALDKGKPWDVKRVSVSGKMISLNDLENKIIRPTFKDARIHFAVNCGAVSCPPLMNAAFTGDKVQSQLEARAKSFINDAKFNVITASSIKVSKIFEWYKEDFGDIALYLKKYNTSTPAKASIQYQEYVWSINGK